MTLFRPLKSFVLGGFFCLTCAAFLALPAFAQEEGVPPEDSNLGWVFRWLNFTLVFGAIAYTLVRYAAPVFRARASAIEAAITEGARAREEAERRRKEAEAKLTGLEAEITAMRAQARADAEADAQRLRALTREEAAKLERAAELEIAAAERAARMELKVRAARSAVERAAALLQKELTPSADSQLVRGFVVDLAGRRN